MQLAPLVPLRQGSLRYRLAYLISDLGTYIFGPPTYMGEPMEVTPRPAVMSCWQLGYKIAKNLLAAALVLGVFVWFLSAGGLLMAVLLTNSIEMQMMFGGIFAFAVASSLWVRYRMGKRLHVFKRKICPLFVVCT
jgi:hypothetical protein